MSGGFLKDNKEVLLGLAAVGAGAALPGLLGAGAAAAGPGAASEMALLGSLEGAGAGAFTGGAAAATGAGMLGSMDKLGKGLSIANAASGLLGGDEQAPPQHAMPLPIGGVQPTQQMPGIPPMSATFPTTVIDDEKRRRMARFGGYYG